MPRPKEMLGAEKAFREAFDRLKRGVPATLPKGTAVTQNNVAREAGCDPSALRKTRYPELIRDIQSWVGAAPVAKERSATSLVEAARGENRTLRKSMLSARAQLSAMASELLATRAALIESNAENVRLKSEGDGKNVVPFIRPRSTR